ncbi:pentapeptide repeat-containing protein [Roseovarius mucosus]|uniref:pentapeptide repeat-containing protein n=1 Tax=Roseovarius mucosus TaxID=215743 RepID=UPI001C5EAA38|nr:pentapeptide repeat-containing protein [Roseovarius mucosus]MBW4975723.1 pentapeptide repeat-containing protein [Roseovarius mucosus]
MKDKEPPQDLLDWMGVKNAPNWVGTRSFGRLIGTLLVVAVPALFVGSLIAAFVVLWHTVDLAINGEGGAINLGVGALITALLGAPFLIWSTVLKHQTVRYQKEGHITDRINKAVEQLGAEKSVKRDGTETTEPNIEVRIGAILSLERIAQDSTRYDKGRDHVRVMEILCAYVRENSNARAPRDFPLPDWEPLKDDATKAERKAHEMWREVRFRDRYNANAREWAESLPKPRADIAQTLQVLGRRTAEQRRVEAAWPNPPEKETVWPFDVPCPELPEDTDDSLPNSVEMSELKERLGLWRRSLRVYSGYRLDLSGANLQAADLSAKRPDASDAVFAGTLFKGARMEGSSSYRVSMQGAELSGAKLIGANFRNASINGANLQCAHMEGAACRRAELKVSNLDETRLEGAELDWAKIEFTTLSDARLEFVHLNRVRLDGADLSFSRFESAMLIGARMLGTDLQAERFNEADLRWVLMDVKTNVTDTVFHCAVIRDQDLSNVPFLAAQINSMFGDACIILPKDIRRPMHWPDWELPSDGPNAFDTEYRKWRANPDAYTPPPQP